MRQKHYTLRRETADFVVEEVLDITPQDWGDFALYSLTKENLDTPMALNIARAALRANSGLGHCGMKDRHSLSTQHFTIPWNKDLPKDFKERRVKGKLLGRTDEPLTLGTHAGNRFEITLRDLSDKLLDRIKNTYRPLQDLAIPNYFDSQRFTYHVTPPGDAISLIMDERYEDALRQLIATPFRKERKNIKDAKRAVRDNWGDWEKAIKALGKDAPGKFRQVLLDLKRKPEEHLEAVKTFGKQPLKMALNAHQSFHWNVVLKEMVVEAYGFDQLTRVKYQAGELMLPDMNQTGIRSKLDADALLTIKLAEDLTKIAGHNLLPTGPPDALDLEPLKEFGLKANSHMRPLFFRVPNLRIIGKGDEGGKSGKWARVRFTLPPGAYATIVVKTLTGY
jgi:tRNA pseudouridine13 synthase